MADTRIVYGANCTWWDSIDKVSCVPNSSLPCCPFCGSVLFEVPNEDSFWKGSEEYEKTHPNYRAMLKWMRGKCFRDMTMAEKTYKEYLAEKEV